MGIKKKHDALKVGGSLQGVGLGENSGPFLRGGKKGVAKERSRAACNIMTVGWGGKWVWPLKARTGSFKNKFPC